MPATAQLPAVSIVLPTYDRLAFLREAVASVLAQTFSNWELIVVDDGSTDDSVAWLESLREPRIIVVREPHTGHKAWLRNQGLARARAEWIAFLDSDDRWPPMKLERHLDWHAANPGIRWSYTGRVFIDGDSNPIPLDRFKTWKPVSGRILRQVIEMEANIALPSVIAERAVLREVGGFNEGWRSAEDYELWLRLAEYCDCGLLDEPLLEIRKHRALTGQRPDVSLGFARMFRSFAGRSPDAELRSLARRGAAYHAVDAADMFGAQRRWSDVRRALTIALRARPMSPFAYRALARAVGRLLRSAFSRSTAPGA